MSLYSICQRCAGDRNNHWNVHQAEFHIGAINHWKVQLCEPCTTVVEQALLKALHLSSPAAETPQENA